MWDEIQLFVAKYGSYWLIALFAVAVSKLYANEEQNLRTIIRSVIAALLFVYTLVDFGIASGIDAAMFSVYVLIGAFLIDAQVELLMALKKRIIRNPGSFLSFFFKGKDK